MNWNDLQDARSFPDSTPPEGAVEIGRITRKVGVFIYYRGRGGELYYQTEQSRKYAEHMEAVQRERKRQRDLAE